jgi:ferric-dicitrate binding protein FerR (iron transport regulator)
MRPTHHAPSLPIDVLDRYLAGHATPRDTQLVAQWLAAHSITVHELRHARQGAWSTDVAVEQMRTRLAAQRTGESVLAHREGKAPSVARRSPWLLRHNLGRVLVGSVAILCVVFGVFLTHRGLSRDGLAPATYQTRPGETASIRLADGSTIILAPATVVTMTPAAARVTGEAYFTIAPRAARAFIVQTKNAKVRILGTRFSVRQYPGEMHSRVVVEDGRVELSPTRTPSMRGARTVVSARMVALVSDSGVTVSSGVSTQEYTSWTHGTLEFPGVPLRDVVSELARAYGTDIRIADSTLAQRVVRIEVSVSTDALSSVLQSLCRVLDAHLTHVGRALVLVPGRDTTNARPVAPSHHLFPQPEERYGR